jgi:hypothetical protein
MENRGCYGNEDDDYRISLNSAFGSVRSSLAAVEMTDLAGE